MGGGSSQPRSQSQITTHTILILGDAGVGKTHLIKCLRREQYNQLRDKNTKVKLEDTAYFADSPQGEKTHLKLIELPIVNGDVPTNAKAQNYPKADAVIFLYDLTDHKTFENIPKWVQDFEKYNKKTQYKFLMGTKKDLTDKRCVTTKQIRKMTQLFGLLKGQISVFSFRKTAQQFFAIIRNIKKGRYAQKQQPDYKYKITIVGDSNAGKTCLAERLSLRHFSETVPTIGVNMKTKLMVDSNNSYKFQITDTSGCEHLRLNMYDYFKQADAVILVFDANHRKGQESLVPWFEEIKKHCSEDIPIIIVGNKADIIQKTQIKTPQGLFLSKNYPFFFCSAKTGQNIELVTQILLSKFDPPKKESQGIDLQELLEGASLGVGNGLGQMLLLRHLLQGLKDL